MSSLSSRAVSVAFAAGLIISLATPALADDHFHPTPDTGVSSSPAADFQSDDADGDSATRERELQARYGHDRDIATPPLIVKQSFSSGKFVTKAIHVRHSANDAAPASAPSQTLAAKPISVAAGKTVVESLQPSDFESPAAQFMKFAYVAMGLLVILLVVLAIGVTSRKDRLNR